MDFDPKFISCHPHVRAFYEEVNANIHEQLAEIDDELRHYELIEDSDLIQQTLSGPRKRTARKETKSKRKKKHSR
jgi:hypothetical protein